MKTLTVLAAAMLVAPLAAQLPDRGGQGRIMLFGEFMRPREVIIGNPTPTTELKDQAENQIGLGFRLMGEVPRLNNWYYELGGKLESSSKFAITPSAANNYTNTTGLKYKYSYWMAGFGYMWDLSPGLNLGAHLEVRGEALNASGDFYTGGTASNPGPAQHVDHSTTYVRPWFRLNMDYAFKAAGTSPFIGLDASLAMLKGTQDKGLAPTQWNDNSVKSMAPQATFSVYLGMRF